MKSCDTAPGMQPYFISGVAYAGWNAAAPTWELESGHSPLLSLPFSLLTEKCFYIDFVAVKALPGTSLLHIFPPFA